LNHDTEITPDFLVKAVAAARQDPKIGSVQSLLLLSPDKDLVNSTGNAIHFLGFGYCLDYRRKAADVQKEYAGTRREIAYGSGAGVLFRCDLLKKIGLLDEELFLYHEDLDLGWRVRLAGFKNVFVPESVIFHKYEFSRSISKYYFMERNRYVVFLKNLRVRSLVVLLPFMLGAELGLLPAAIRSGWWREKLRSYAYFFLPSTWRRISRERREMAKLRVVSDREIVRLWSSTISYQEVAGTFTKYVANPLMTATWAVIRNLIF
jgi:GT2 family glycosyltransferase